MFLGWGMGCIYEGEKKNVMRKGEMFRIKEGR